MPTRNVANEIHLQHNGVTIYKTYKDDNEEYPREYWFTLDPYGGEDWPGEFDVRELDAWDCDLEIDEVLRKAIDNGEIQANDEFELVDQAAEDRLHGAAEDMLDTLKNILENIDAGRIIETRPCGFVEKVKTVVAKAEGTKPDLPESAETLQARTEAIARSFSEAAGPCLWIVYDDDQSKIMGHATQYDDAAGIADCLNNVRVLRVPL